MDLNTAQKNLGPGPCQRQHCKEWPQHRCLQTLLVTTAMDIRHVNCNFFVNLCNMLPGCKDMSQKIEILRHVFLVIAILCNMSYCLFDFLQHVSFFKMCCYSILGTCWFKPVGGKVCSSFGLRSRLWGCWA